MRLFLNPGSSAYLRGLAEEFDESTNSVRLELNRFEEAGMLNTKTIGNKKIYSANNKHPLFKDINNILIKYIGIDKVIDTIVHNVGRVERVYLTGDYAYGKDSGVIDLIFIGDINTQYLVGLIEKAEKLIEKKIRYLIYSEDEQILHKIPSGNGVPVLLIWENIKEEKGKNI